MIHYPPTSRRWIVSSLMELNVFFFKNKPSNRKSLAWINPYPYCSNSPSAAVRKRDETICHDRIKCQLMLTNEGKETPTTVFCALSLAWILMLGWFIPILRIQGLRAIGIQPIFRAYIIETASNDLLYIVWLLHHHQPVDRISDNHFWFVKLPSNTTWDIGTAVHCSCGGGQLWGEVNRHWYVSFLHPLS